MTGRCIFFHADRGYGFLSRDGGGPDIFVHFSNLDQSGYKKLDRGDQVEYNVETGPNGKPQAVNVRLLQKAVA